MRQTGILHCFAMHVVLLFYNIFTIHLLVSRIGYIFYISISLLWVCLMMFFPKKGFKGVGGVKMFESSSQLFQASVSRLQDLDKYPGGQKTHYGTLSIKYAITSLETKRREN